MLDADAQQYLATLRAFRDHQVTPGSPMHRALSASVRLLERERAVRQLVAAIAATHLSDELEALANAVAKQTP